MIIEAEAVWRSPVQGTLFESPLWCAQTASLYWVDVVDASIHRHCFADGISRRWDMPRPPGSIALVSATRLLVAMRAALVILDTETGTHTPYPWQGPALEEDRFNDGVTDRRGNFWVGTMDRKLATPRARLFRIGAGGRASVTPVGARLSNGLAFSPDGRRLYLSKTFEREIRSFAVDPQSGALSDERLLVAYDESTVGQPDGSTVAADGTLWSARIGAGCIDRYDADGRPLGRVVLPTSHPTHCMFGGADMRTLFVATSRFGEAFAGEHADDAEAGRMLGFRVDCAGLLPAPFAHAGR